MQLRKAIRDLEPGDAVGEQGARPWYHVFGVPRLHSGRTVVDVQFPDGGIEPRVWDDGGATVPIIVEADA